MTVLNEASLKRVKEDNKHRWLQEKYERLYFLSDILMNTFNRRHIGLLQQAYADELVLNCNLTNMFNITYKTGVTPGQKTVEDISKVAFKHPNAWFPPRQSLQKLSTLVDWHTHYIQSCGDFCSSYPPLDTITCVVKKERGWSFNSGPEGKVNKVSELLPNMMSSLELTMSCLPQEIQQATPKKKRKHVSSTNASQSVKFRKSSTPRTLKFT